MELQVGVKIILQNKEGKYLMLFRSSKTDSKVGEYWDTPGGRINIGSPLMENLEREIKEETGLHIDGAPKLLAAEDIFKTDKHVVRLTYLGFAEGEVKLSEEHTEYKWLSKDEVLNLDPIDKYFKAVFEKYIK